MKAWVLAGLITAAAAPFAAASETTIECQVDRTRRAEQPRIDEAPPPAPTAARPTVAQREAAETPRPAPALERRRNGKRVPDAELIGPRGAL